jgi:alpha,alpha-trehalase
MNLDVAAKEVLARNDLGGYTVPRPNLYPFQWNWDSCLVALGFMTYDEPRAWQEIDMLFRGQWTNGMVPHIVYHKDDDAYSPGPEIWQTVSKHGIKTSGITQPPVAAFCVRKMLKSAKDKNLALVKAKELFPKIIAYHRWFWDYRDPDKTGLVTIVHPWESGRDNSPDWVEALNNVPTDNLMGYQRKDTDHVDADQRPKQHIYDGFMALVQHFLEHKHDPFLRIRTSPFKVRDTTVNFIFARANIDLLHLATELDFLEYQDEIKSWIDRCKGGLRQLWCEEDKTFYCYDVMQDKLIRSESSGAFTCFLPSLLDEKQSRHMLNKIDAYANEVDFLMPSHSPFSSEYDAKRYWCGPVWAIVNFMIYDGLHQTGYQDHALKIARDTSEVMKRGGFAEYYDPHTGEGLGGQDFSWTAAMWLHWLSPLQDKLGLQDEAVA